MKNWIGFGAFAVLATTFAWAAPQLKDPVRTSKFFRVDLREKRILGTNDYIQPALRLDLVSTTTDQPQYWPNEKVFVKVLALHRPGQTLSGTWQKRDSAGHSFEAKLNADGVAVVEILDGAKQKLELGEYRVDLKSKETSEDKRTSSSTTFAVVDGALGAISFAHEWKRVTTIADLEKSDGAWFLGNPAGAGTRWGNGLSFKNEIRVANRPYAGEVTINSRCMLPGCSGTYAGHNLVRTVKDGKIEGTLEVGGHSGPFQIEVITPQGSLRYQFEGSSHVERDMMEVAGGVGWSHRVGLAPYENTTQVPGRQLYLESKKSDEASPFEAASVVAQKGALSLSIKKAVRHARLVVWSPKPDGSYAAKQTIEKGELAAGDKLAVPIAGPFSLVTIGGFVDGKFREGWLLGFTPSALEVALGLPDSGGPNQPLTVDIAVKGGGKVSGVLEVYDNRVASKSAASPLGSALGDSVRATSRAVSSWSDNTGIVELDEDREPREKRKADEKEMDGLQGAMGKVSSGSGYGRGAGGLGGRSAAAPPMLQAAPAKPGRAHSGGSGGGGASDEDYVPKDIIREGEKKVVACQLVETDAAGKARVTVTLPPQTGRVIARFVAVKGLDYAEAQKTADVKLSAFADARLPRVLQHGAELKLHVDVTNSLLAPVSLLVKGTGVADELRQIVAPGHAGADVTFAPRESGKLILQVADSAGKPIDRRELAVDFLEDQSVTWSRLEFGSGQGEVQVGPNEEVVVYPGAGPLLQGAAMNLFTTTESWFGHSEALSAQAAVHAVLLAAIDRGLLSDEGIGEQLRSTLNKSIRSLDEKFCDHQEALCRPYPGLAPNARWSGWVSRNLHSVIRALDKIQKKDARVTEALTLSKQMAARIDAALKSKKVSTLESGYDDGGESVIPVEIDGKVVYRVVTDDAVARWAVDKLLPRFDWDARSLELGFAKDYDTYRFLKAFERTGALPYLTDVAKALYLKGERQKFAQLYRQITRGMILTQEPGLIQGPALLGGVYSTPMAMVKFLELQLLMQTGAGKQTARLDGRVVPFGERVTGGGKLTLPEGAIARIDERRRLSWDTADGLGVGEPASVRLSAVHARIGDELGMEINLSGDLDPAEYYAIIAVPSTVAVKQTEDILSDYRGQLIYGQQVTGGTRMQLLAVPFRGARSMKLLLEGAYAGHSPGKVIIRHIEKAGAAAVRPLPDVTVE
jgi:hypothetical protein